MMKTDHLQPACAAMATRRFTAAAALALTFGFASAAVAADAPATPASSAARTAAPKRVFFTSPQEAADALIAALRDDNYKQLARVLGPGHQRIVDSGDNAADRAESRKFVADYDRKHALQMEGDAKAFITTGDSDWPMPIPIVKQAGGWTFDAVAGESELLARRIGRNELDTIQVCLAFIDMEREYAEVDRNGDGLLEYTARLISTPGKRDGLYWPAAAGEPQSPAGPRLAEADPKDIKAKRGATPYHGYYYRVLTAQGKNAPGGARSYYANGKLIGGVSLIAYPASYLNSGVKTFMCNLDGKVHEKDFGPNTAAEVGKIKAYDPDPSWTLTK